MPVITTTIDGIPHRSDGRNEARMLVEIETDVVGGLTVAEQHIETPYPKPGSKPEVFKRTLVCYESQLHGIRAQVRTDAHIAAFEQCKSMARSSLAKKRAELDHTLAQAKGQAARERAERELVAHEGDVMRKALELLHDVPGCTGGLPPLLAVRVVKSNCPAPETQTNQMMNAQANGNAELAAMLARLFDERATGKGKPARE